MGGAQWLVLAACALLSSACGGESEDSTNTSGAGGASGGSNSGGASGSANGGAGGGGATGASAGAAGGGATSNMGGNGGFAGSAGASGSTGAGARPAMSCDTIDADLAAFVERSKACRTTVDCTVAYGDCTGIVEFCDGSVYMNSDYDSRAFLGLLDRWRQCMGDIDCAACDAIGPPPACIDGRCVAAIR